MSKPAISIEHRDGGVVLLQLDRPEQRNALDREMFEALADTFDTVDKDRSARAVVLTGAGNAFCSGAHHSALLEQAALDPEQRRAGIASVSEILLRSRRCRLPVVCAVNGHAIAAGAVLALSGDLVVAAESAKIGLGFVRLGLYPAVGSTWWLQRLVGRYRAFELLALGDVLTAERACERGLITAVHSRESLMEEALALAGRLAAGPPMAMERIKAAMRAGESSTLEAALTLDVEYQAACAASEDLQEGLAAFLERRDPVFRGR